MFVVSSKYMSLKYGFKAKKIIREGRVEQESVDELRSWCVLQNLSFLSDEQLVLFLLCNANDGKEAQAMIKAYFRCKKQEPKLFFNRDIDGEDLQQIVKVWFVYSNIRHSNDCDIVCRSEIALIPTRTHANEAVIFGRLKDTCYKHYSLERVVKLCAMIAELPLFRDPPDGVVGVIDLKGFTLLHLANMKLKTLKILMSYAQEAYPCRVKHVHVLNAVSFTQKIILTLRPFMKKEFFNLVDFHPKSMDMNDFFRKNVPVECVPKEYGGLLSTMEVLSLETYKMLRNLKTFYDKEEQQIRSTTFSNV